MLVHSQVMHFRLIKQELLGVSHQVTLNAHKDIVVEVVHVRINAAGQEQLHKCVYFVGGGGKKEGGRREVR